MSRAERKFVPIEERVPFLAGEGWRRILRRVVEHLLGFDPVRAIVKRAGELVEQEGESAFEALARVMEFEVCAPGLPEVIPREGPLVVIANHPFGGVDAVVLPDLVLRARADVKVLGNNEARAIMGMDRHVIPLEILGGEDAVRKNAGMLREALRHLQSGGALVVFPAGAVAHWQWHSARVEDPTWPEHTARLVRKSGADVLPVWFSGRNGPLFQLLGALHPLLRSALLPRAFLVRKGQLVFCRAGAVINNADLPEGTGEMTEALRVAVEGIPGTEGN
ncbi:MAG: 1-acyl-sn-glycerol-3-phosphate acyltransferase [Verrucomicrobiota bacterium]|nr:1-acyl-sn-glycerol-3-phosphate acyltransferase [Verrucomicrobiota bacterium]